MSWTTWIEIDTGGPEPTEIETEGEPGNYTYNVAPMYHDAFGHRLSDLNDHLCGEAAALLTPGIERMKADPEHYRAMNPENGWGSYEGALDFLERIREVCLRHPRATLRII